MLKPVRSSHFSRAGWFAAAAALVVGGATIRPRAQTPSASPSTFLVFFRSTPVGNEQIAVQKSSNGWAITSSGRIGPPFDLIVRSLQARYDADWKPLELTLDATLRGQAATMHTVVTGTTAQTETTPFGATPVAKSDQIDGRAILLPNPFIAPYEALAARLKTADPGSRISIYQPGQGSFDVEVGGTTTEHIMTVDRTITARRTHSSFNLPNVPPLDVEVWGDEEGRLLRVSIPAQSLEFAREDIASVSARLVTMSRPNDEDFRIPANGFSLAGTVSKPANASGKLPAVVLVGGSDPTDRDENIFGIPIFGQIADVLADAGFLVLRYDKRGVGQSGGRTEAARLEHFAEDARAAVKAMSDRKDVDRKRLAIVGHSEGGWIALMAAKDNRIAAVGLVSTVAVTGRELNLYQVTHGLERSTRTESERQATIDLQKQIQQAVVTGLGWDQVHVSEAVRRQADTPYFQSFLTLDPAKLMKDVQQPLLILQGERDTQVPPANVEKLETLAKARKKAASVKAVTIPGINHLLVPANTGEVDEYGRLTDRHVSSAVTTELITWLRQTFQAIR
jgi:pimeloyl-ACP methyl ester carboxylesterase